MSREAFNEVGNCISTWCSLPYVSTLYGETKILEKRYRYFACKRHFMSVSKPTHISTGIVEKARDHLSRRFIKYVTTSE